MPASPMITRGFESAAKEATCFLSLVIVALRPMSSGESRMTVQTTEANEGSAGEVAARSLGSCGEWSLDSEGLWTRD